MRQSVANRRWIRQREHGVLNIHKLSLRHSRIGDFALGLMNNRKRSSLWSQALRSFWSQSSAIFFSRRESLEFTYLGEVAHTVCFHPPWITASSSAPGRWGLIPPMLAEIPWFLLEDGEWIIKCWWKPLKLMVNKKNVPGYNWMQIMIQCLMHKIVV